MPFSGYAMYDTGGCAGRNELGTATGTALAACQALCDNDASCLSFEFLPSDSTCQRSSTCSYALSAKDGGSAWHLYVKTATVPIYAMYDTGGCTGRNELGTATGTALAACQALCDNDASCLSFEFRPSDSKCQRSSTCSYALSNKAGNGAWHLYVKTANAATALPTTSPTCGLPSTHARTYARTHARTYARTHARTHVYHPYLYHLHTIYTCMDLPSAD